MVRAQPAGEHSHAVLAVKRRCVNKSARLARVGLLAPVAPSVTGVSKTRLTMELYEDDGSGALPPPAIGTFSLATAPDNKQGPFQPVLLAVGDDLRSPPVPDCSP